jgi:tRNA(Arg) A34 adenosine deaminase TadA
MTLISRNRRKLMQHALTATAAIALPNQLLATESDHPNRAWYDEAKRMRDLAESWGDQSYGAVVVAGGRVIGFGPSRVIKDNDPNAHAERVAIREAQLIQSNPQLKGAVMYSTSRPCFACEQAASKAGILRMYFGDSMHNAGVPRPH